TELGAHWQDEDHSPKYEGEIYIPQDDIDVYVRSEEERKKLLAGVLRCEVTGKPFKITPPELAFYMRNEIPIPRMHFDQRFIERFQLRNPRRLFSRQCDNCHQEIISTFSQSRPEKVYCEECYQRAVV
ncbi:hypothetical protein KGQ71_02495, partial [Patescibacteria group bacterium]|nr:hypothetical protein [Patescibacteria group bacterium]